MKEQYKKILKSIDFLLIIVFFCIPPIFAHHDHNTPYKVITNLSVWLYAIAQIALLAALSWLKRPSISVTKQPHAILKIVIKTTVCLIAIFAIGAMFNSIVPQTKPEITHTAIPSPAILILATLVFATREEILYRLYLIDAGIYAGIPTMGAAALSVILFATAHAPAGIIPTLNAFLCGIILTICRFETRSIWAPILIHSIYNSVLFLTLS